MVESSLENGSPVSQRRIPPPADLFEKKPSIGLAFQFLAADQQTGCRLRYNAAMSDVTRILSAIEQGDTKASAELLPLVYDELRRLAAQKLVREKGGTDVAGDWPGA